MRKIIFLFIVSGFLFSCNETDEVNNDNIITGQVANEISDEVVGEVANGTIDEVIGEVANETTDEVITELADEVTPVTTNELNGQWNLIAVSCLCEPVNLTKGEILWNFDIVTSKLTVVNNVTESLQTILKTGTYDITVTNDKVTIQTVEYDYYFENGKLYLADDPASDGPLIEFLK